MPSNLLTSINSKRPCINCGQQNLYTNDTPSYDEISHYTCLSCGFSFCENKEQREYSRRTTDKQVNSWDSGLLILLLMLFAILAINHDKMTNQTIRQSEVIAQ